MSTEIRLRLSPEEEELAKKKDELALLQVELADRELHLANLRVQLAAFEGSYLRCVGVLYAELDEWSAKLAELVAEENGTEQAHDVANQARVRATESRAASQCEAAEAKDFVISPELKSLYREVAKRIHPDLATGDAIRKHRERLMTDVNRAYENGDAEELRRILQEYEDSPDSVCGTGVAADLVRVLRQLKQVENRLAQIEEEIVALEGSDIANLRAKSEAASSHGRDLLFEMAANVQDRINAVKGQCEIKATRVRTNP